MNIELIDFGSILPFAFIFLIFLLVYLKRRKKKTSGYLICFAVFYIYLVCVIGYTILPLRFDKEFIEALRRSNVLLSSRINLIPFYGISIDYLLSIQCIGNIALGIPFGFGLPFIAEGNLRYVIKKGIIFAISIELIQFIISLIYRFPYRTVDINDILFNFLGVIIGFIILHFLSIIYRHMMPMDESVKGVWYHFHTVLMKQ